ncbi:MAG: hypothetical protein SGCHY_003985 [Lobulomycetales sp.]
MQRACERLRAEQRAAGKRPVNVIRKYLTRKKQLADRLVALKRPLVPPTLLIPLAARSKDLTQACVEKYSRICRVAETPYHASLAARIYGNIPPAPRKSLWTGKILPAYIWRNKRVPATGRVRLLAEIRSSKDDPAGLDITLPDSMTIDYVYFQSRHLDQVNRLLRDQFWESVDVSECLNWPDYSIIAMHGKLVVGCAFLSPECYLTYLAVREGWQRLGIGRFMLFHLIKLTSRTRDAAGGSQGDNSGARDITLHVSVDNPAMILYQMFGFKTEKYMYVFHCYLYKRSVDFYANYLPEDAGSLKHACYMRRRGR